MIQMEHIKCPLHRYTFKIRVIREWVEKQCEGTVLNLFAGRTLLAVSETRNDIDPLALAQYHLDAVTFLKKWGNGLFNTIILDPPYSYRKSMELYNGKMCSPFRQLKDEITNCLEKGGKVITFGYQSIVMGNKRGFDLEKLCIFSHGGAVHDTIATVERYNKG